MKSMPMLAAAFAIVSASPALAQNVREAPGLELNQRVNTKAATASIADFAGIWTYRSYRNEPDVVVGDDPGAAGRALGLLFGEGVMTIMVDSSGKISGTFDMGGGLVLDLHGKARLIGGRPFAHIVGPGRPGTGTDAWEYDYDGSIAAIWPAGVGQIPAITGTVFRAKPHGASKAGYVASFIAVKR